MKIQVSKSGDTAFARRELTTQETQEYGRLTALGMRIGLYGYPFVFLAWLFSGQPLAGFDLSAVDVMVFFMTLLLTPLVHELMHMAALPAAALHRDAMLLVRIDGWRSGLSYRPGGSLIGLAFAWMCAAPLAVLTILPFALHVNGQLESLHVGMLAAYNFALSGVDMVQAIVVARHAALHKVA
jgi:hypothetical protein